MKFKDVEVDQMIMAPSLYKKAGVDSMKNWAGLEFTIDPEDEVFVRRNFDDLEIGSIFKDEELYLTKAMTRFGVVNGRAILFAGEEVWGL